MGLEETEDEKDFKEFNNWVQKKLRLNTRKTWCSVILFASSDERDALEKFYKFWDEFLKRNESDSEE
ncbi:hypothetical protein CKA32_005884 [Geitlerinema sp. FC II]|nr:hypothetical protein CKA32_005884 [Geitlerinema sp. FC II]